LFSPERGEGEKWWEEKGVKRKQERGRERGRERNRLAAALIPQGILVKTDK
jgi:hypothetical protein